ncbi:MAG TPA: tetratricopeptide repeat protein, partial [Verrucomicrobiae bacterium]|nr:tetratricopeptide repeat protein [Verrucomicrobiae bacterium]
QRRFPQNFTDEYLLGMAYSQEKDYTNALQHFTTAEILAKNSDPKRLTDAFYFQLGASSERAGDYGQAEKYFLKSLALAPDSAETLNYLGYMWAERGENLDEARSMIDRAVQSEPENAAFLDSMAWVLFKLKQPKEALGYMNRAMAHSEKPDPTLLEHLGDIQADLKQFDQARESYAKSLALKPDEKIKQKLDTLAPR